MNSEDSIPDSDVVVIDDNVLTLELLGRVLRNSGCAVQYFVDELDAISYLVSHTTRVLIVDHRMPRIDGLELLQRLLQKGEIPAESIYLCSASELPSKIADEAQKLGARILSKDVFRNKAEFLQLVA